MTVALYIILALLISVFASSTNVDLFTNTNFLLLMLLAIGAYYFPRRQNCTNSSGQILTDLTF